MLLPFVSSCSPGQNGPLTTQLVRPPKQQSRVQSFSGTVSAGLRASTGFRKQARSRACVIGGDKRWRESESRVEAHRRRKKPDLLSPPKKSTADVCSQILPLPPIMETHAKICSASEFSSLCTHLQTRRLTQFTYLCVLMQLHSRA